MSNDIFNINDYNKRINNIDAINTIYTTKGNSKNKINYNSIITNKNKNINTNNTKKKNKKKKKKKKLT